MPLLDADAREDFPLPLRELLAFDGLPLFLVQERDNDLVISDYNETFETLFSASNFQTAELADYFTSEDGQACWISAAIAALNANEPYQTTVLFQDESDKPCWFELKLAPSGNEPTSSGLAVGTLLDVTHHVEISKQAAIERDREAKANQAKKAFIANISHELRTPITTILGMLELLVIEEDEARKSELSALIRDSGTFLLHLIDDMLDMSQIEADKFSLQFETCSLAPLLYEICSLVKHRAAENNLELRVSVPTDIQPEQIRIDPNRLRQILTNLLGNAIKFTETGFVELKAESVEEDLLFSVRDSGPGISEQHQREIFTPFERTDSEVSKTHEGTGLGLSISRRLAQRLGGDLSLQSEVGIGSTFTLRLPLASLKVTDPVPSGFAGEGSTDNDCQTASENLDGIRVLVAEDTRGVRVLITLLLERAGAEVHTAANGKEAVELYSLLQERESPCQVVLMDMEMPVLSGREALFHLRESGCRTPIVALTANAMKGDRERFLELGCDEYISKPIDRERLLEVVNQLVDSTTKR